jgi:hypothetical protein
MFSLEEWFLQSLANLREGSHGIEAARRTQLFLHAGFVSLILIYIGL